MKVVAERSLVDNGAGSRVVTLPDEIIDALGDPDDVYWCLDETDGRVVLVSPVDLTVE